jgi:alanine racemase
MTLRTRLALVKPLEEGTWVGYGDSWQVPDDTMMGLVPIGYGDGVPRAAGNKVEVWIGGRLCPIIGCVAMDQFIVDLGGDAQDRAGDEVVCFGAGDQGEPTADQWAERMDTIGYEIVTRVGPRIPRRYH